MPPIIYVKHKIDLYQGEQVQMLFIESLITPLSRQRQDVLCTPQVQQCLSFINQVIQLFISNNFCIKIQVC